MTTSRPRINDALAEAAELVITSRFGSTAMLQRKLGLGFADAGHVMNALEKAGVVGPHRDDRARDVLIDRDQLDDVLRRLDTQDAIPAGLLGQDAIDLIGRLDHQTSIPQADLTPEAREFVELVFDADEEPGAPVETASRDDVIRQLAEVRSELARVDAKAGNLLALAGMALGVGLTVLSRAHLPQLAALAGAVSALAIAVAVWFLARAVRPDLSGGGGFLRLVHAIPTPAPSIDHEQLVWLACLTRRKFLRVRIAVDLLCVALVGTVAAAVLTAWL